MKKEYNQIYIVKEGDNLEKIAEKYKVSPLSILITNNITPKMIKKGKVIFIKNNFWFFINIFDIFLKLNINFLSNFSIFYFLQYFFIFLTVLFIYF